MPVKQPTNEEIARLAYFLFEERGQEHGQDVEDWLAAEAHLCTDEKHAPKPSKDVRRAPQQGQIVVPHPSPEETT